MNLAPFADALVGLAAAVASTCIPVVTMFVLRKVGLDKDTALRDSLDAALQNGVGVAMAAAHLAGDHALQNVQIKNAALATVVQYAAQNAPDAVAHFGLSDTDLAQKASAKLALLLHVGVATPPAPEHEPIAPVVLDPHPVAGTA